MFESLKKKNVEALIKQALDRESEEKLFAQVVQEVEAGHRRDGLWAKALVEAEGNEHKAKVAYIQLRAQSIIDEQILGSLRQAESEKKAADAMEAQKKAEAEQEQLAKNFWRDATVDQLKTKFAQKGMELRETDDGWAVIYSDGETRQTIWRTGLKNLYQRGP